MAVNLERTKPIVRASYAWVVKELVVSSRHRPLDEVPRHVAIGNDVVIAAISDKLRCVTLSLDPEHPVPLCGTKSPNQWTVWLGERQNDLRCVKCNRSMWAIHFEVARLVGGEA